MSAIERVAVEDHTVRHMGSEGDECGGPHYCPPDGRSAWAYCESGGTWFRVDDDSEDDGLRWGVLDYEVEEAEDE